MIAKKIGMSRVFTEDGDSVPVTILEVPHNIIISRKTTENGGYNALKLSAFDVKENKVSKPIQGVFKKLDLKPKKFIKEFRNLDLEGLDTGDEIPLTSFEVGSFVNIRSKSKGKGFAGTIKRHNFKGKDATHGNSISHRTPGSTGQCQFPGRVFKGKKMAGQMGNTFVTKKNLKIVQIDEEKRLMMVKGSIPGFNGREVFIQSSVKKAV